MAGYGWEEYDARVGGRQVIHDADNHLDITIDFVKVPGGEHGGSWGARISGNLREGASKDTKSTVVFYASTEGFGGLRISNQYDPLGYEGSVNLVGHSPDLGQFRMEITEGSAKNRHPGAEHESYHDKPLDRSFVKSFQLPDTALWQAKGKRIPRKSIIFTSINCY